MQRLLISISVLAILAGCASSSAPISIGKDRFMLTAQGGWDWNGGAVLQDLVKQGAAFCLERGESFELLDSKSQDAQSYPVARVATATIEFTCRK